MFTTDYQTDAAQNSIVPNCLNYLQKSKRLIRQPPPPLTTCLLFIQNLMYFAGGSKRARAR